MATDEVTGDESGEGGGDGVFFFPESQPTNAWL